MEHTNYKTIYFDVFKREFPICDVARGLIGDSHILRKGIPLSEDVIIQRKWFNAYPQQTSQETLFFYVI